MRICPLGRISEVFSECFDGRIPIVAPDVNPGFQLKTHDLFPRDVKPTMRLSGRFVFFFYGKDIWIVAINLISRETESPKMLDVLRFAT